MTKVDYGKRDVDRDMAALRKAKKMEAEYKDRLERIEINGGYILTTRRDLHEQEGAT